MLLVLRALLVLGWASLLHAGKKSSVVTVKLDRSTGLKLKSIRLILDPSVLAPFTNSSTSFIANSSLSPWTYKDCYAPSRFPERIVQAVCSTRACLKSEVGGEDSALKVKPIKYQVLVLRRVQKESKMKDGRRKPKKKKYFQLGTEVISVGCTCVRPSVVTQQ